MKKWFEDSLLRFIALLVCLMIVATYFFQYSLFDGEFVGIEQGKVHSTFYKTFLGFRTAVSVQKAEVVTTEGERLIVICEHYCKLDMEVDIKVYQPFFRDKLIYKYDGN